MRDILEELCNEFQLLGCDLADDGKGPGDPAYDRGARLYKMSREALECAKSQTKETPDA